MKKLSRSGIIPGNPRCHVLKFRIINETYNKLLKLQEENNFCMAFLLRHLLYEGLGRYVELSEEEKSE